MKSEFINIKCWRECRNSSGKCIHYFKYKGVSKCKAMDVTLTPNDLKSNKCDQIIKRCI